MRPVQLAPTDRNGAAGFGPARNGWQWARYERVRHLRVSFPVFTDQWQGPERLGREGFGWVGRGLQSQRVAYESRFVRFPVQLSTKGLARRVRVGRGSVGLGTQWLGNRSGLGTGRPRVQPGVISTSGAA